MNIKDCNANMTLARDVDQPLVLFVFSKLGSHSGYREESCKANAKYHRRAI